MKTIEVYVHTNEAVDPKLIKVSEESTVKQLLEQIASLGGLDGKVDDDLVVLAEDSEEPFEHHRKLCECEIRHRHHIHCHRCRKVKVSVFYNGEHSETFPPSATVRRVLKWALKAFKLSPAESADKILVLKGNPDEELSMDAHIGSFAKPHQCSVDLCLTAPVEVQG